MSNLIVLSYITEQKVNSFNLESSLIKYGYNYQFLGLGDKWKGFVSSKIQKVLEFCITHNEYDLFCVVDGYDMLASGPLEELICKYKTFNTDIVYGGEKTNILSKCHASVIKYHDLSSLHYRKYINGGFCIGKRQGLINLYTWILKKSKEINSEDDQKLLGLYMNNYPSRISIDVSSDIVFNSVSFIDILNIDKNRERLYIKTTNTQPCFVHFPSNKSDMYIRDNIYGVFILKDDYVKIQYKGFSKQYLILVSIISILAIISMVTIKCIYSYTKTKYQNKIKLDLIK